MTEDGSGTGGHGMTNALGCFLDFALLLTLSMIRRRFSSAITS